jgi:hypothetical protein
MAKAKAVCAAADCKERIEPRIGGFRNTPGGEVYCSLACAAAARDCQD